MHILSTHGQQKMPCIHRSPICSSKLCSYADQGLSRYLETGCPNRGFIDFCVSKVLYKIHTTNKIDPIPLQILLFRPDTALCVL